MPPIQGPLAMEKIIKNADIALAVLVVVIIMMMIIPIPTIFLNLLLAANITLALVVLLTVVYLDKAVDFAVFPSLILVTTLFRLSLNISSTRLILLEGRAGVEGIITAFGDFVVGGNYIVGVVIFLALVMIQLIVIVKGATRVAEVAARFTLDAMPGKQMSIDADLNAGTITREEADKRRIEIRREADFYGAMDGAAKFVSGDVTAGIVLTVINVLGGLAIGMWQRGESFQDAAQTYTLLTIGDGLVAQIPALLQSTAMGLIVTRAANVDNLGKDLSTQLTANPRAMGITSGTLFFLGLATPLPFFPFVTAGAVTAFLSVAGLQTRKAAEDKVKEEATRKKTPTKGPEDVTALLAVEAMELEIGYGLIPLVDREQGGDLLDRIANIRRRSAIDLGIVVPPIRIRDNMQLKANDYIIKIRGVGVGSFSVYPERFLGMAHVKIKEPVPGESVREPAFGIPSVWIYEKDRERAEAAGYTVVDATTVIATHLTELIKRHAADLLTRQETQKILDHVKETAPALVDESIRKVQLGGIQKVLQMLLREGISVRDMVTILETVADRAEQLPDPLHRAEAVRAALARSICESIKEPDGSLHVITLAPDLEARINEQVVFQPEQASVNLPPPDLRGIIDSFRAELKKLIDEGYPAIILTSPRIRAAVRDLLAPFIPNAKVISFNEVAQGIVLKTKGSVKSPALAGVV
ncbi:flagellar biosynthesis protein FlhA [bacterium]|nr:flagellar biosynthesis protein FlhA [bacterium]